MVRAVEEMPGSGGIREQHSEPLLEASTEPTQRFFFHLEDNGEHLDDEGFLLPSLEDAKCAAVQIIAETLCHEPKRFWTAETYRVRVTNDEGLVLFTVELVATLAPALSGGLTQR